MTLRERKNNKRKNQKGETFSNPIRIIRHNSLRSKNKQTMKDYTMQVANMKKPQEFTLYPYKGGEQIMLQSDKRFAIVNLRTGHGIIDSKNHNYPNTITVQTSNIKFELPKEVRDEIIKFLSQNNGKDGNVVGVMSFENAKLSETIS